MTGSGTVSLICTGFGLTCRVDACNRDLATRRNHIWLAVGNCARIEAP